MCSQKARKTDCDLVVVEMQMFSTPVRTCVCKRRHKGGISVIEVSVPREVCEGGFFFALRYPSVAVVVQGTGQINKCATAFTLQACEDRPSLPALHTDTLSGY